MSACHAEDEGSIPFAGSIFLFIGVLMMLFIISLITTVLFSLTMIIFGLIFVKKAPKKINYLYGYRTPMSMKNKATWVFAHKYAGKVWIISGIINLVVSVIITIILKDIKRFNIFMLMLIFMQIIILLLVIPLTEVALRKKFDKDGNKKSFS